MADLERRNFILRKQARFRGWSLSPVDSPCIDPGWTSYIQYTVRSMQIICIPPGVSWYSSCNHIIDKKHFTEVLACSARVREEYSNYLASKAKDIKRHWNVEFERPPFVAYGKSYFAQPKGAPCRPGVTGHGFLLRAHASLNYMEVLTPLVYVTPLNLAFVQKANVQVWCGCLQEKQYYLCKNNGMKNTCAVLGKLWDWETHVAIKLIPCVVNPKSCQGVGVSKGWDLRNSPATLNQPGVEGSADDDEHRKYRTFISASNNSHPIKMNTFK